MHFTETDVKASEDDLFLQAHVHVEGDHTHNFTLTATPLTLEQYLDEPGKYGNSCLSVINTNIDPAEGMYVALSWLYYCIDITANLPEAKKQDKLPEKAGLLV